MGHGEHFLLRQNVWGGLWDADSHLRAGQGKGQGPLLLLPERARAVVRRIRTGPTAEAGRERGSGVESLARELRQRAQGPHLLARASSPQAENQDQWQVIPSRNSTPSAAATGIARAWTLKAARTTPIGTSTRSATRPPTSPRT